jgi:hypothetical protein
LLCLAGTAIASAIMTNFVIVLFLPALAAYYFVRSRGTSIQELLTDVAGTLAGILGTTLIYCLAYFKLTGFFNIFGPALRYIKGQPNVNPWCPVGFEWIEHALWLVLPAVAAFVAVIFLFKRRAAWSERSKYLALAAANLIAVASFTCMQLLGTPFLSLSYYSCMLLPFCLGTLIALIGNIISLETCNRGMLFGALIAASPAGVLFISWIFREFFSASGLCFWSRNPHLSGLMEMAATILTSFPVSPSPSTLRIARQRNFFLNTCELINIFIILRDSWHLVFLSKMSLVIRC